MKDIQVSSSGGAATQATGASLFLPYSSRTVELRNRIVTSPMCQYSSEDGFASDWHLVHLGSRAVGGAGLVFTEATAVSPQGRISPQDLGIWKDEHIPMLARVTRFVHEHGAAPGIQLAHAGRKASTARSWDGGGPVGPHAGGWVPVGPGTEAFKEGQAAPHALTEPEIEAVIDSFRLAAGRALKAGFQVVEIHAAHGYLLHQFLSPLVNHRPDSWGGSLENRARLTLEVARAIRTVWPAELPLWIRISGTDWAAGGWDVDSSVQLARWLGPLGVDLVDVSSGGAVTQQQVVVGPGYQVPFSARIRRESGLATGAVGLSTEPAQADAIIRAGEADVILLARAELRDPYWPLHAAQALGLDLPWPAPYDRARSR